LFVWTFITYLNRQVTWVRERVMYKMSDNINR